MADFSMQIHPGHPDTGGHPVVDYFGTADGVWDGVHMNDPGINQQPADQFQIAQGFLEEANVESVLEMVRMIDVYRSYEADQRAIQVQDSTLDRAVNDIGVVR